MAKGIYVGAKRNAVKYKLLEYIESTGTQYIDTGVIGKTGLSVICDFEVVSGDLSDLIIIGCAPASYSPRIYPIASQSSKFAYGYGNWYNSTKTFSLNTRYRVSTKFDADAQSMTVNDSSTLSSAVTTTYNIGLTMALFGANIGGTPKGYGSQRIYSCKIYDNDTLIRDFVPVLSNDNIPGLYDKLNGVLYKSGSASNFTAGNETGEYVVAFPEVDNIAHKTKKMYIGVDDIARKVKKGYVGDANGIARLFYSGGLPLSSLPYGTLVNINVNGVTTNFIIVNQGIPQNSSLYDSSCNGTWLLMKDVYSNTMAWDSSNNKLAESDIHTFLNGNFLNLLDNDLQSAIKQIKIPYYEGGGYGLTTHTGADGLSTKVFLLSPYELGASAQDHLPVDGAALDYFADINSSGVNSKRLAYHNGSVVRWWTRSAHGYYGNKIWFVDTTGRTVQYDSCDIAVSYYARPAFVLPSTLDVNPIPNADGSYNLIL